MENKTSSSVKTRRIAVMAMLAAISFAVLLLARRHGVAETHAAFACLERPVAHQERDKGEGVFARMRRGGRRGL